MEIFRKYVVLALLFALILGVSMFFASLVYWVFTQNDPGMFGLAGASIAFFSLIVLRLMGGDL